MNSVIMSGRLTKDPDVRYGGQDNEKCVARYTIAVNRQYKTDKAPTADFVNCISTGKTAEYIEKYLHKGNLVIIDGSVQSGSYKNKEGKTIYYTEVFVERIENLTKREDATAEKEKTNEGFINIPDSLDEDGLPFN